MSSGETCGIPTQVVVHSTVQHSFLHCDHRMRVLSDVNIRGSWVTSQELSVIFPFAGGEAGKEG